VWLARLDEQTRTVHLQQSATNVPLGSSLVSVRLVLMRAYLALRAVPTQTASRERNAKHVTLDTTHRPARQRVAFVLKVVMMAIHRAILPAFSVATVNIRQKE
jgi:hypothetical protein